MEISEYLKPALTTNRYLFRDRYKIGGNHDKDAD